MKALIKKPFRTVFVAGIVDYIDFEDYDEDNISFFEEGVEVEILKIVNDSTYVSGKAYVVYEPITNASTTVDESWLTIQ